jgi:cyclic pyranopterin phosphate synthase
MNYKLDNQTTLPDATSGQQIVRDQLSRPLHDLRISVIDRCNFRCKYCMPEENEAGPYKFLEETEWLTFPEIERLTRLFVRLGVTKVRLTGGEPLLRPNLPDLIKALQNIPGITDLALTTNGSLLTEQAEALKSTGLNRITVSLDAIDPDIFRQINGRKGNLQKILDGITKCEELDFECIKINVVIQKNVNDHQILDLVRYFKNRKPILRFIEYMDVGNCNHWNAQSVVPAAQMVDTINARFPIRPAQSNYFGEVASRYQFVDGSGEVGFIPSITQPFCRSCTRARLSTDGKVYTCLFATGGTDLKSYLRTNASDDEILNAIKSIWQSRDDRYSELRSQIPPQSHHLPKVEMFQIGG